MTISPLTQNTQNTHNSSNQEYAEQRGLFETKPARQRLLRHRQPRKAKDFKQQVAAALAAFEPSGQDSRDKCIKEREIRGRRVILWTHNPEYRGAGYIYAKWSDYK